MDLNKESHFCLLASDTYTQDCLAAGMDFLRRRRVAKARMESELSAWMTLAVLRTAQAVSDDRWHPGWLVARATNRAYRENTRAARSVIAGNPVHYPHPEDACYARAVGDAPNTSHMVAVCSTGEIVDLLHWRWRDLDCGVSAAAAAWVPTMEGSRLNAADLLQGAEFESYAVAAVTLGDVGSGWVALCEQARAAVDDAIGIR